MAGGTLLVPLRDQGRDGKGAIAAYRPIQDRRRAVSAFIRVAEEVPVLAPIPGPNREVACWLHRDGASVPPELSLPDPAETIRERLTPVNLQ